jgi:Glutathione S-transferase
MPREGAHYTSMLEKAFSPNIHRAFEWLESELANGLSNGKFLVGTDLTAADIIMAFSIEVIFVLKLGTERGNWPHVEKWLDGMMQREAYKKAVQKTGYSL